jgi:hypothetical protein
MIIQAINQTFNTMSTKVTQPTGDAILCDTQGYQLVWDATAKWFKWIPVGGENYNTGYLQMYTTVGPNGISGAINKRDQTAGTVIWINSNPSLAPTITLTTTSSAIITGSLNILQNDLKPAFDFIYHIELNINTPDGAALNATADSFITSFIQIAQWT